MTIQSDHDVHHPIMATGGMVVSQEALATEVGVNILNQGGNAIDAAVAMGFALAVTLPKAGNIGGGGHMVAWLAERKETVALDYREQAPGAARKEIYWDESGEWDLPKSQQGYLAPAVPGTVAGFAHALEQWGSMPWETLLRPGIRLAEEGIKVTVELADSLEQHQDLLRISEPGRAVFFKADRKPYAWGDTWKQPNLARTLRTLASDGPRAFYEGDIAKDLVESLAAKGGLITLEDLASYTAAPRTPVEGSYRGHRIVSMPPSSSGGILILQVLNLLEGFPLRELGHNTAETLHLMAEAFKLAYADRIKHLGDSDFWPVPRAGLISKRYADSLRGQIDPARVRPAEEISAGNPLAYESPDTTHYTVADRFGNVVSNTYTLLSAFGSGVVAGETGILLNNNMANLDAKPGSLNHFGLIGSEANSVAPRRRPLSSMTPTLVFADGKPWLATGSPGGTRVMTIVLQVLMNVIDHGLNLAEASHARRIHHQLIPNLLQVEAGHNRDTLRLLEKMGHVLSTEIAMGSTQSILIEDGVFHGASDPRRGSALAQGLTA